MSDYDNTNRGAIYKNDQYEEGGNWPRYKGKINVDGKDYAISMWLREASGKGQLPAGTKYFSAQVEEWKAKPKDNQQQGSGFQPAPTEAPDIPF